jgi:hypothetical protein
LKRWNILTLRKLNAHRLRVTGAVVILAETSPEAPGLHPYSGIDLWVVVRGATVHLDGNERFLDLVATPPERRLYDKFQKSAETRSVAELRTVQNPLEMKPNFLDARTRVRTCCRRL